jgi:hypothetical protein
MDIDDANAEINEQYVIAQEQTVFAGFDMDGQPIGELVDPNTLEAIALSNQMRIMQINAMLQSNPERIPAVESVLGISGYLGS